MTVALFCPVWACGAGIFSSDPVTMETGYMGHGEAFYPNSSELDLNQLLGFSSCTVCKKDTGAWSHEGINMSSICVFCFVIQCFCAFLSVAHHPAIQANAFIMKVHSYSGKFSLVHLPLRICLPTFIITSIPETPALYLTICFCCH